MSTRLGLDHINFLMNSPSAFAEFSQNTQLDWPLVGANGVWHSLFRQQEPWPNLKAFWIQMFSQISWEPLERKLLSDKIAWTQTDQSLALGIAVRFELHRHDQSIYIRAQKISSRDPSAEAAFYKRIIDELPVDIAVFGTDHRYKFVNPGAIKNEELRAKIIGMDDFEFCEYRGRDPQIAHNHRKMFNQILESGETLRWEDTIRDPQGIDHTVLRQLYPLRNSKNEIDLMVGFGLNISDRKRMEVELEKAKLAAEAADKAKSQFLANMSHELRTPLNTILGLGQIQAEEAEDQSQIEQAKDLIKASEHLLYLIDEILDFSKLETGNFRLSPQESDLGRLLTSIKDDFKVKAAAAKLNAKIWISPQLICKVKWDHNHMEQVIRHLIDNAIQHTPQGWIEVFFDVDNRRQGLQVRILNSGNPLPEHIKIGNYRKFEQADNSDTRHIGGIGLGLAYCQHVIRIANGFLFHHQAKEHILCEAFLPYENCSIDQQRKPELDIQNPAPQGATIHLVDDNAMNRKMLRLLVQKILPHCQISESENGQEALEFCCEHQPNLIFMDIQMPVLDGFESAKAIRKLSNGSQIVPIVACTAGARNSDEYPNFQNLMDGFLSKPIKIENLKEILSLHGFL